MPEPTIPAAAGITLATQAAAVPVLSVLGVSLGLRPDREATMSEKKLTDSEIAELRANHKERDHWRWLFSLLRRLALWTVAVVAGVHALIEDGAELLKWLRQGP